VMMYARMTMHMSTLFSYRLSLSSDSCTCTT
jgi:hypothetical protein